MGDAVSESEFVVAPATRRSLRARQFDRTKPKATIAELPAMIEIPVLSATAISSCLMKESNGLTDERARLAPSLTQRDVAHCLL
jgi:hypothetical protein